MLAGYLQRKLELSVNFSGSNKKYAVSLRFQRKAVYQICVLLSGSIKPSINSNKDCRLRRNSYNSRNNYLSLEENMLLERHKTPAVSKLKS